MLKGFAGKILKVNLTTGAIATEEKDEAFYRRYMGGNGFIAHYLLTEMDPSADPLGPDNVLVFATGAITGLPIAGAGRSAVGCKSPLTGGYGEADGGGYFGAELKQAGFDAVVITGKAAEPVYLWIHDGEAEIRSASHLWGMTTLECQTALQEELDRRARLAMIGPGGEKLVRYACVINDLRHAAGRSGTGAVMGSKNLKAIAARGKPNVPVADDEKFKELSRWMVRNWKDKAWGLHDTGTDGGLMDLNEVGALPTRNFQDGQFEGAEKITGSTMRDTILTGREGCYACPIRCKRVVEVHDEEYDVDPIYGGPEYETVGSFGSVCGVDDLRAISKAHELCNAYSLDTISAGMTVAFAMECFEQGIITTADTGGLELRFGNAPAMVEMTRRLCEREGALADLLAEGPAIAAKKLGPAAEPFVIAVKGQPFPMHEARYRHGQGLGYAVSPTGADHMHNFWDEGLAKAVPDDSLQSLGVHTSVPQTELTPVKVRAYKSVSNWQWVHNHLGHCMFIPWTRDQMVDIVRAITGWETTVHELLLVGERGVTMARSFNLLCGLGRKDDVLPLRLNTHFRAGVVNEAPIDPEVLDESVSLFYEMMGWDAERGVPTKAKLQELDLAWVADLL